MYTTLTKEGKMEVSIKFVDYEVRFTPLAKDVVRVWLLDRDGNVLQYKDEHREELALAIKLVTGDR